MAERGEAGIGRMAEPLEIVAAAEALLAGGGSLAGKRVLVTSGPTSEPIDPVRLIANRSSGKQGHAIAAAAAAAGADVVLVSGPVNLPDPPGVSVVRVETAQQMLAAVEKALPADVAIFAAAVADWRPRSVSASKIKKQRGRPPTLELSKIPTSCRPSRTANPAGRGWSSALPRRPMTSSPTPRPSSTRKAATGSSPTTFRRQPASWAATATPFTWSRRRRRNLAAAIEGRRRARADRAHCRRAGGADGRSVEVRIMRLPHGADLPLPQYQSAQAAGLDLLAAVPAERRSRSRPAPAP